MNRVYKVIWSKAKHCYVVTSEIAKGYGKSAGSKGVKALLSGLMALSIAMGGYGLAGAVVYVDSKVATEGAYTTKVYTADDADGNFATKDELNAKANAADVASTYVNKTKAEVTYLTVSGDVEANGNLKVGNGNFTVSGITGDVKTGNLTTTGSAAIGDGLTVEGYTEMKGDLGVNGNIKTNSGFIQTGGGNINTQGGALRTNGGNINAGNGLIQTTGTVKAGKVQTGTLTTTGSAEIGGTLTVNGKLNMDEIDMTKNGIVVDDNNVTASTKVAAGEITGYKKATSTKDGSEKESAIDYDEKGTSTWAIATDAHKKWNKSTLTVEGSDVKSEVVDSEKNSNLSTQLSDKTKEEMSRADGKTASYLRGAVEEKSELTDGDKKTTIDTLADHTITNIKDGTNESIDLQKADQISSSVTDSTNTTVVSQNAGSLIFSITDEANKTSTGVTQTATDITNTAKNGTIANEAKDITNHATENMTNTVGGNLTTTVTGDSSLTAENITNEAKNKITNKALDVKTDAASSIVSKVSNDAGSNTSTQWSYQTKEEMSQTDGKTASYLRGAVEEKSQLTDGDKKTTIDTVAGQTNTNITDGTNTSNDLQKADQIASSVTKGTNKTVVNQDAGSLASSITDGSKFNNSFHWVDGSEQLIKVDDNHFYAETRTVKNAEETLKSGNTVINIVKDTTTATVSSAVFDGATITGISQNAKDISLSAAGGTITNDAKDVLNKGANSVINKVGDNKVAVKTDRVKVAYGSDTYTTWNDKGITSNTSGNMSNSATNITNSATKKLSNSAADIKNSATESITDKVGENVKRTMITNKISESVKDGTKSNSFSKTAERDINIITDGTNTSTLSQLSDKVNTSLKEVDGDGKTTKSLNNVKTVSEDTTKMTDAASGAFSKRSQTVSQIQDKVGKTTVTTIDGKTTLTDEDHNHTTEMDYANVTKDLSVERDTTLGKKGEDTNLTVNSKSEFKDTVKMDSTLEVDRTSKFNDKVTITNNGLAVTGGTTTDTLTVTGTSEFRGKADFKDNVSMGNDLAVKGETKTGTLHVEKDGYVGGNLNVEGNIETHDAELSETSRQVVTGRQLYQTNERVDRLDNRIKKVGANAAALAALRPGDFNPDDKFSIAAGFGSYRNANAAALGLFYRPNENVLISLGTSFGDGENMVNAGVSVKFGRGKSMAGRRKEMADEVSSMRDEMRSQDERIAELEEMLKKQSELIEKLSKES